MNLSAWSLMLGLMSISDDVMTATFYRRMMVISWSFLYVEILCFVLLLTKNKHLHNRWWKERFGLDVVMGINLSMVQLKSFDLESVIEKLIIETGLSPNKLEFEITESLFMDDTEVITAKLNVIKTLGVNISIDDFGTEYSSLNYLKTLPINRIKIPKPFIDRIGKNQKDEAIISSLVVLAEKLDCRVTAEGVEYKGQLSFLKEIKCEDIQGYYFYKAMCVKDVEHEIIELLEYVD